MRLRQEVPSRAGLITLQERKQAPTPERGSPKTLLEEKAPHDEPWLKSTSGALTWKQMRPPTSFQSVAYACENINLVSADIIGAYFITIGIADL